MRLKLSLCTLNGNVIRELSMLRVVCIESTEEGVLYDHVCMCARVCLSELIRSQSK